MTNKPEEKEEDLEKAPQELNVMQKYEEEFFNRLSSRLEEIFPKTNQENPEIPSEGNRSGALTFNAYANIIFKDILEKALSHHTLTTEQRIREEEKAKIISEE